VRERADINSVLIQGGTATVDHGNDAPREVLPAQADIYDLPRGAAAQPTSALAALRRDAALRATLVL